MAIRINITANVSNIPEIRKKIENQLKNINFGKTGQIVSDKNLENIDKASKSAAYLVNQFKAKDISREKFIVDAKKEIETLKQTTSYLGDRARLTEYLGRVEKQRFKDVEAENKKLLELQKKNNKALNLYIQYQNQLKAQKSIDTKVAQYKKESDALRQLVKDGKRGILSTKEMKQASEELILSLKKQERGIQDLGGKVKGGIKARQEQQAQLKEIIKWYEKEEQARKKALSQNVKSAIKAETNASKQRVKVLQDEIKAREKAIAQEKQLAQRYEKKAVDTSFKQQQQQMSDAIQNTIKQYEKGVTTLNDFILKSRELTKEYKNVAGASKDLKQMYNALDKAATKYWTDVEKGAAAEKKAIAEAKAARKAETLVLREQQAIRAALNRLKREVAGEADKKDIQSAKTYNAVLKEQIALLKAKRISAQEFLAITNRLIQQERNYGNISNSMAQQVQATRKQAADTVKRQAKESEKLNKSLQRQTIGLTAVNKGFKSYIANLGMIIKKFSEWILVGSIVFLPIRVFQDAIEYIREMDDALTDLNKVVELSKRQLDDMRLASIELGKSLGVSSAEIMRGMAEFGRVTKNQKEIIELSKAATVAANVTTMTADDAAKAINTTLITFKKDVSEAMDIINSFNEIQNNYRTSAEDLAQSIGKVGAAARQAGLSLDELSGYTTAIVSATGVTGNIAGTAIKSIVSRLFRIGTEGEASAGKAEQVLQEVGVAVRNASGDFRQFDEIISDLNGKWDGLSKVTKQNVAQTIAGTYHYSRFLALMENYDLALEATSKSINSQNSAMDENQKHLQSITGRLGTLTSTIQEKFAESLSADLIKMIVSELTVLVDTFGSLRNAILLVVAAIGLWKGTQITQWILNAIGALGAYNIAIGKTVILTQAGATKTLSLNLALRTLAQTIKANPIGLLVAGISAVVFWMDKQEKKTRDLLETNSARHEQIKREVDLLNDSVNYYEENYFLVEKDAQVKQELVSIQDRLVETYGFEARQIDLVNGKYEDQIELLKNLRVEELEKLKKELTFEEEQLPTSFISPAFRNGFDGLVVTSTRLGHATAKLTDETKQLGKAQRLAVVDYKYELESMIAKIEDSGDADVMVANRFLSSYKQKNEALEALGIKLDEVNKIQEKRTYLQKVEQELTEKNIISTEKFTEKSKKAYDILKNKLDDQKAGFTTALKEAFETASGSEFANIEKAVTTLNSQLATGEIAFSDYDASIRKIKDTLSDMGFTTDEIDTLFEFETGLQKVDLSVEELSSNYEKASHVLDGTIEKLTLLQTAYDELNDDQKLSSSTTAELIAAYPQLNNVIGDTAKLIEYLNTLYGKESKAAQGYYKDSLESSEDFYNGIKEQGIDLFEGLDESYKKDLSQYKTIQQAKADMTNELFILETSKNINEYIARLEKSGLEFNIEWIGTFQSKDQEMQKLKNAINVINDYLDETGEKLVFEELAKNTEDLNDEFDELIGNLGTVAGAIEQLSEDEEVNAETMLQLIELYPQLADSMEDNAKLLEALKNLHGEEAEAAREAYKEKLKNNEEFIKGMITNNEGYWNGLMTAYGTDLNNWKQYMKRKGEMSKITAEIIGEQWNIDLEQSFEEATALEAWAGDLYSDEAFETLSDVSGFIGAMKLDRDINKELDKISSKIDFTKIGFSDEYLDPDKNKDAKKLSEVQIEQFIELKQAIDEVNDALAKNASLYNLAKTDEDRIRILNKEVELLKSKRTALEALVIALRGERTERVKDLKTFGVTFEGSGDELKMTNIDDILAAQKDKVNKLAKSGDEDLYERENERLSKLTTLYERFLEIQRNTIPATLNEILEGSIREFEIGENIEDIELENFGELAERLQKRLEPINKEIERLNRELSSTEAEDYTARAELLSQIFDTTSRKSTILAENIGILNDTEAQSEKVIKAITDATNEYRDAVDESKFSLVENTKAQEDNIKAKKEADKKFADDTITDFIEWYNKTIEKQIEQLEKLSDVESDLADQRLKDNKLLIDGLNEEIKLLKEKRDVKKSEQEEEKFKKEITKQQELIKNLQKERTRKVFTKDLGWVWTVDTVKIKEEQEKLKDLEQDFQNWKDDKVIEDKEKNVKALEDDNEKIVDSYDDEIQALKDSLIDKADIIDDDTKVATSYQALISELSSIDDTYYFNSLKKLRTHFDGMQKVIDDEGLDWSVIDEEIKDLKEKISGAATKPPSEEEIAAPEEEITTEREDADVFRYNRKFFTDIMQDNSKKWLTSNSIEERQSLAEQNEELGTKMGWTKKDGIWYDENGIQAYKNGGIVDFTGLAWLDGSKTSPERVLSSEQNKIFTSIMGSIPAIAQATSESKSEIYNISIDKIQTNDALGFVNNLKKLTYIKGRGA